MSHNNITYQMHTDKSQYQTPNLWPPSLQRLHLFPMHLGQNLQNKIKSVFSNPNVISSSHLKNFRNPHHTPKTSGIPPPTPQKPQESPPPPPPHPPLFQENKQVVRQNFEKKRWIIGVECLLCVIQDCGTLQEFAFTNVRNVCCVLYTIVTLFKIFPWQISLESVR